MKRMPSPISDKMTSSDLKEASDVCNTRSPAELTNAAKALDPERFERLVHELLRLRTRVAGKTDVWPGAQNLRKPLCVCGIVR